jgi:WD40 repeat protein
MIVAGSQEHVMIWDLRKMKVMHHFTELHSDEVTSVKFSWFSPNLILTAGEDWLFNLLDLKDAELEDEFLEASHTSEQPLANWGFIGKSGFAYTITSINTIEIIDLETMLVVNNWNSFEHEINYAIQGQFIDDKMLFFLGNNLGEVYIYQYFPQSNEIEYLDMLMTREQVKVEGEQSMDEIVIRNAFWIDDKNLCISSDYGDLYHFRFDDSWDKTAKLDIKDEIKVEMPKSELKNFEQMMLEEDIEEIAPKRTEHKKRKYKPY